MNFANVQCSKDTYDLMDSTVMPSIKQQISQLNSSSVVVVYHQKNMTKSFRSYIVPASIHEANITFLQTFDATMMITTYHQSQ